MAINKACESTGKRMARMLFAKRAGSRRPSVEIFISEIDLALALAAAAQVGFEIAMKAADEMRRQDEAAIAADEG
jgi:hypothetical protein